MKRNIRFAVLLLAVISLFSTPLSHSQRPANVEQRVNALLSQMTLAEKLGQLQQLDGEGNGNFRPEHLDLVTGSDDGVEAEVVVIEPTGSETQLFARLGGQEIVAVFRERHDFAPGQTIRLKPRAPVAHLFDASSGQRI